MGKIIKILAVVLWIIIGIKTFFFDGDSGQYTIVTLLLILVLETNKE